MGSWEKAAGCPHVCVAKVCFYFLLWSFSLENVCVLGLVGGLFLFLRLCLYVFICCLFAMNKKFYVTPRLVLSALVSGSLLTDSNEVSGVGGNSGIGYGGASSGGARTRGRSWAEED